MTCTILEYATFTRYARVSASYSIHWSMLYFMRLINMAWESGGGGSARGAIFAMLYP